MKGYLNMRTKQLLLSAIVLSSAAVLTAAPVSASADNMTDGWRTENGSFYWYENGVRQGVRYNEDGSPDISYRGKEIYDPGSDAWYWLDCVQNGAKAVSKDVYQESKADDAGNIGKWVRYDADGHMVKGWQTTEAGTYFFDYTYGTMYKGDKVIDDVSYHFDETTGLLDGGAPADDNGSSFAIDGWHKVDGTEYWYEGGVRQGVRYNVDGSLDTSYRGKEIYDPSTDAWYWLDCVLGGAKAASKDVYQESKADDAGNIGKWVRYDENGHMIKGWQTTEAGTYFFDYTYGTMAKGEVIMDGFKYTFDKATGILVSKEEYVPVTEVKIIDGKPVAMLGDKVDSTYSGELTSEDGRVYRFVDGQAVYGRYWVESVPYVYDESTGERLSVNADTDTAEEANIIVTKNERGTILDVTWNLADGWHVIDGKAYYGKDGKPVRDSFMLNNHIYIFCRNTNGTICSLIKSDEELVACRMNGRSSIRSGGTAETCSTAYASRRRPEVYDAGVQFDKLTGKVLHAKVKDCGTVDAWGNVVAHADTDNVAIRYYCYAYDSYGNKLTIWDTKYQYDADKPVSEWDFMPEKLDYYQDNVDLPTEVLYDPATGQLGPAMSEFGDRANAVMTGLTVRYERIYTEGFSYSDKAGYGQYTYYNVRYVGDYSEDFLKYLADNGYDAPDKSAPTMSKEQIAERVEERKADTEDGINGGYYTIVRTE